MNSGDFNMMRMLATALAAGLLLSGQAAAAGDTTAATPAAPPPSATPAHTSRLDPNEVICKREDVSGSRLGGARICHTRQQWADIAAQYREATDRLQQNSVTNGPH
jgi:hypothetical protein